MKVGDKVAIIGSYGTLEIGHIERETKLYWYANGLRFSKKSSCAKGQNGFRNYTIVIATQHHLDEAKKRRLAKKLTDTNWSKLDLETLEKVFAAVCGMTDTKENKQ